VVTVLAARRDLVVAELAKVDRFETFRPAGAFYAFPRFDAKMSSAALGERILKEAKVAVTPGSAFGDAGETHLRLSFAASRETIVEGIRRIRGIVENL